jgi:hypothetical protein
MRKLNAKRLRFESAHESSLIRRAGVTAPAFRLGKLAVRQHNADLRSAL